MRVALTSKGILLKTIKSGRYKSITLLLNFERISKEGS